MLNIGFAGPGPDYRHRLAHHKWGADSHQTGLNTALHVNNDADNLDLPDNTGILNQS